jgi:TolB-like protein
MPPSQDANRRNARIAATLAVAVLLLTGLGMALYFRARDRLSGATRRVLVVPFQNATGDTALASLGRTASDWIAGEVARTGLIEVVTDSAIPPAPGDAAVREAATRHAAATVISGRYELQGDSIRLQPRVFDAPTWKLLLDAPPVSAPRSSPEALLEPLRRRVFALMAATHDRRFADLIAK